MKDDFSVFYPALHNDNAGLSDKAGTSNRNKISLKDRVRNWYFARTFVDKMGGGNYLCDKVLRLERQMEHTLK